MILEVKQIICGSVVWSVILIIAIIKLIQYCCHRLVKQKVDTSKSSAKNRYEYLVVPVLSNPAKGFSLTNTIISLQLLHYETTVLTFNINLNKADISRDICCHRYIRGFLQLYSKTSLLPITHLKAVHNSKGEIFMNGIELEDLWSGRRLYYNFNEMIKSGTNVQTIASVIVKPQELKLCTKETFCPNFENPSLSTFGRDLNQTSTMKTRGQELHGISIKPKLNWFEMTVFYAFLMNLIFLANVLILFAIYDLKIKLKGIDKYIKIVVSIVLSGFVPLIVTDIMALIYNYCIKSKYNTSVSLSAKEKLIACNLMPIILYIYLLIVIGLTISSSIGVQYLLRLFDYSELTESVQISGLNDILFVIMFVISLVVTFTLWLIILGFIKYIFNFMTFNPKIVRDDISIITDMSSTDSKKDPTRDEKEEQLKTKINVKIKGKVKAKDPNVIRFDTTRLDNDANDKHKVKRVSTGSLIHSPTHSKGYINPEEFRITESKVFK
ncbi:uncharacterized protein LOC128955966 [Oppia nitens]|uniref:uncharacterized protein LOC128955966 n=1 Tax=Oppia nitens TaxID=1686743 RepID=UPI0023DC672D|nr:uncharacterized protein LOC128955966 [Oppia nitens]